MPTGRTQFKSQGSPTHLELRRSESEIQVDSFYPQDDFAVRKSGEEVKIDHFGFEFDTTFRRQGQDIEVDRPGIHQDMKVERNGSSIKLDRPGVQGDVTITFSGDRVDVRPFDVSQRVTLERHRATVASRRGRACRPPAPDCRRPGQMGSRRGGHGRSGQGGQTGPDPRFQFVLSIAWSEEHTDGASVHFRYLRELH